VASKNYSLAQYNLIRPLRRDGEIGRSGGPRTNQADLQGFLADRFKLEIHRETKDLAVMAMMVGKNGPKIGTAKPEGPVEIIIVDHAEKTPTETRSDLSSVSLT